MDSKSRPAKPPRSAKRRPSGGQKKPTRQRAGSEGTGAPAGEAPVEETPAPPSLPAGPRRAVFIDVENTSSEADLLRIMETLEIDLTSGRTEVVAVGNWRVAGQQLGRTLAQRGAQLVHSAPAPRVPDWSDLWIAVSAGMWLGRSRPGDRIDIVSDDRAFDAIGDAAARLGVAFRRISYRTHATADGAAAGAATSVVGRARAGGRRRRRRRGGGDKTGAAPAGAAAMHSAAAGALEEEPQSASQDHIRATIARLTAGDPERCVNLDALSVALKAEGFQRPAGSPRLVTRLRRLKDVEVLPSGRVRLVGAAAEIATAALAAGQGAVVAVDEAGAARPGADGAPHDQTGVPPSKRRARRRGGGRRRRAKAASAKAPG